MTPFDDENSCNSFYTIVRNKINEKTGRRRPQQTICLEICLVSNPRIFGYIKFNS
jgi:hypothetical protein